jgi:hypothetical protein
LSPQIEVEILRTILGDIIRITMLHPPRRMLGSTVVVLDVLVVIFVGGKINYINIYNFFNLKDYNTNNFYKKNNWNKFV